MRTWYCRLCSTLLKKHTYYLLKGRPGCEECQHYEVRCEPAA